MKKIVTGILAHVDSGKTTLSEAVLYTTGSIRKLGRVDHRDAFLDTNKIERERGITIFSHQAIIRTEDIQLNILDTPGHVDFTAETERTLCVLDYAVLVVSGTEKVQSHTLTLWKLLKKHSIPTFIFINKMDLAAADKDEVLADLKSKLSDKCLDFFGSDFYDLAAMCSEALMNEYLQTDTVSKDTVKSAISNRDIFPCFFGSALKLEGVEEFLRVFFEYVKEPKRRDGFSARVFKISEDEKGNRLTHMKITGGKLAVRDMIDDYSEKVTDIRVYSGIKYESVKSVSEGDVCAVTGLTKTRAGEGLGGERSAGELTTEPVFSYKVTIPPDISPAAAMENLKRLEEEETQLNVVWNKHFGEIRLQLMGEVQLEVIKRIIAERFSMDVSFEQGSIIYKETIENAVEGIGHYEPLRHYAEVHLLLEPLKRGEGLRFQSKCSEDILDRNRQRLVLTHLEEKTHLGVLTGAPITDMKITLISGRAHLKHTEGGDFRQATYRAVRQGLMRAKSVLLEPWYDFSVSLPQQSVGRLMTDISEMGGRINPPESLDNNTAKVSGSAPISKMHGYTAELTSYTHGLGQLSCNFGGYDKCQNTDEVIVNTGYDPEGDLYNSPDSVFCANGSGFTVKWNEVEQYMHLEAVSEKKPHRVSSRGGSASEEIDEEELLRIFELTYGKIQRKSPRPLKTVKEKIKYRKSRPRPDGPEYVLVDGYNIIFAWEDLSRISKSSLEAARDALINRLASYKVMKDIEVIVVFDAYKVKGNRGEVERINNITVVYTKEAETADAYIERTTHELSKKHRVRVATSDNLEQLIILGNGALRVSAREFLAEVEETEAEVRRLIEQEF